MLTQDCATLVLHPTNENLFAGTPAWASIDTPSGRELAQAPGENTGGFIFLWVGSTGEQLTQYWPGAPAIRNWSYRYPTHSAKNAE